MSSSNATLVKQFKAGAAIAKYRIVKFGSSDEHVVQAAAAADALFGVSVEVGADAAEDRLDVVVAGIAEVEFGGTVTRGALVTSDASGKAVAAAPAQGANVRVLGVARVSAAAGDIGSVILSPGSMQGA